MIKIFLPGKLPGFNELEAASRGNKYAAAAEKKKHIKRIANFIFISQGRAVKLERICIDFLWVEPNKKRDPDNFAAGKKLIIDALVHSGIIKNDGWNEIDGFTDNWEIDKTCPGVWVTITEV